MKFWHFIFIFILTACSSYNTEKGTAKNIDASISNYEYIIGKWKLISIDNYDPENLLPKIDSAKFNRLNKEPNSFTFEFNSDTIMIDLTNNEGIKYKFESAKIEKINDFETEDGYIYIPYKAMFKKLDKNKCQFVRVINEGKSMVIVTYQRILN
jgi:hypothetical protein